MAQQWILVSIPGQPPRRYACGLAFLAAYNPAVMLSMCRWYVSAFRRVAQIADWWTVQAMLLVMMVGEGIVEVTPQVVRLPAASVGETPATSWGIREWVA